MATKAKKAKVDSTPAPTKVCPYGAACYRKNPAHFAEFSHPKDGASTSTSKLDASLYSAAAKASVSSTSSALPPCKYGAKCYRKNLLHFAEFSHPTAAPTTAGDSDSGDTDVYDSDDDKDTKKDKGNDVLNRGMSLVKSFSQMTEEERKELIQKAFEAKQKLQEELAATKKQMEQKDKELNRLQEEVNKGILLVEGEEEAMKGDKTVYFPLVPERDYKEGSADQIHFRLAESQFYRLISGQYSTYRVTKVEYVVTPHLVNRFKEAKEKLRKERGENMAGSVLGFHGTSENNITPICETGFKVPGESGFHHKTDTGWYGAGVYFSEYPAYSMGYINGATKLLLCQVLPGKVYECPGLIHGAKLQKGYDSHMSPCKKELIIFNSHHILPCYLVHYANTNTEFKYVKFTPELKRRYEKAFDTSPEELQKKRTKALKAPKSTVLKGLAVKYTGRKADETEMNNLVKKHGGTQGKDSSSNVIVAHEWSKKTKLIQSAMEKDVPVVREEWLYDCILQQKQLEQGPYLHHVYDA